MIRISEIFGPTIQGEGALIGQPTVFVRTGGCDYRCDWCDTLHAVDSRYRQNWTSMSAQDIMDEVQNLSGGKPLMVSLSGGNPAIQPLGPLIKIGQAAGYRFALETQGSVVQDWFCDLDVLTLSPKPPSSAMDTDWGVLKACVNAAENGSKTVLKVVVFDEEDYQYARTVHAQHPHLDFYLQPGNHAASESDVVDQDGLNNRLLWLTDRALRDGWYEAHILPQLHVIMWGNKRGV